MSTRATASFEITAWEQTDYDEPAEGPKLSRATVRKTFRGDIEGESRAELLLCQVDDNSAGYVGMERIVGRIGARGKLCHPALRHTRRRDATGAVARAARLRRGRAARTARRGRIPSRRTWRNLRPRL